MTMVIEAVAVTVTATTTGAAQEAEIRGAIVVIAGEGVGDVPIPGKDPVLEAETGDEQIQGKETDREAGKEAAPIGGVQIPGKGAAPKIVGAQSPGKEAAPTTPKTKIVGVQIPGREAARIKEKIKMMIESRRARENGRHLGYSKENGRHQGCNKENGHHQGCNKENGRFLSR